MSNDLILGEKYTLTDSIVVTHPLGSKKLLPGEQVIYLGNFNDKIIISSISKGEQSNWIAWVIPDMLTKLDNKVIKKAIELIGIFKGTEISRESAVTHINTSDGYKFVKLAEHFLNSTKR